MDEILGPLRSLKGIESQELALTQRQLGSPATESKEQRLTCSSIIPKVDGLGQDRR